MDPSLTDLAPASTRRADARFLLPRAPRSITVLDGLPGWRAAVTALGAAADTEPDLTVARAADVHQAIATGAEMILLEGAGGSRALGRAGLRVHRYLAMPTIERATAFVRVGDRRALELWRALGASPAIWARATRRGVAWWGRWARPPGVGTFTVGVSEDGPPFVLAADEGSHGSPASWMLVPGSDLGDHKRVILRVPSDGTAPSRVVKVGRRPGEREASDRDDAGLALAASHGPLVAAHAPVRLARAEVDGYDVLVETEARRAPLEVLLRRRGGRRQKLDAIAAIGRWLVDVSAATQSSPAARRTAWAWMASETAATWPGFGAPADLFARIDDVPGVLQHADLWVGNVMWSGGDFGIVDWELCRAAGIPLGDLALFLPDALALVDGAGSSAARLEHFVALHRGELATSRLLFDLVDSTAGACGLDGRQVGALVTIALLESGVPPWYDRHLLPVDEMPLRARFARAWLDDPALGPDWPARC